MAAEWRRYGVAVGTAEDMGIGPEMQAIIVCATGRLASVTAGLAATASVEALAELQSSEALPETARR